MRAAETCCNAAAILGSRTALSDIPGAELSCACARQNTTISSETATKIADTRSHDFIDRLILVKSLGKPPHYLWSEKIGVARPQPLTNRCGELNIISSIS